MLTEESFRKDSGLAGSDYPDISKITKIDKNVFNNCKMGGTVRLDSLSGTSNCDSVFNGAAITNVVFPRRDFSLSGQYMFESCTSLKGVFLPGPQSSGASLIRRSRAFYKCTSLKVFLAGPRTGVHSQYGVTDDNMFAGVKGCRIFVPKGDLALGGYYHTWDDLDNYVSGQTIIHYGPEEDLDLAFDHEAKVITAMPVTAHTFTNVVAAASTIKDVFGYDMRIVVKNAIEIDAGSVTKEELAGITFDSLIFSVKTQAQLNTVLAAVPAETPLAIDPEGATENLKVLKADRKLYVMLPKTGTYKVVNGGLVIVVN